MFVDYEILSVNAFSDNNVCTDDTILKNGTFFDCTSTSDNTVLNSSFDQTSVGNNRGCNLAGCSKDEILNHYNNIVQSAGSIELTGKSSLQGGKRKRN